jgi:hypothetical protein
VRGGKTPDSELRVEEIYMDRKVNVWAPRLIEPRRIPCSSRKSVVIDLIDAHCRTECLVRVSHDQERRMIGLCVFDKHMTTGRINQVAAFLRRPSRGARTEAGARGRTPRRALSGLSE